MAVWRQNVLLLLGEPCRMLQLLMHRVISQAGGITVLTVSSDFSSAVGCTSSAGGQECPTPVPAFLKGPESWGVSYSSWLWSIPMLLWL